MTSAPQENFFSKKTFLPLAFLVCFVLFFSLYHLTNSPPTWYDEGMILQLAENVTLHGAMELQLAPGEFVSAWHVSTGYPIVFPVAISFRLFGIGLLQARSVAVLYIILLLCAGMALVYRLYGVHAALWAGLLVGSFSSLYGNGKNVLGEVPGLALLALFFLFWHKLEKSEFSARDSALWAGIFLGFALATKPIFILIIPALCITFLFTWRRLPKKAAWMAWFALGALCACAVWLFTQFGPGDSARSVLGFYANPYHLDNLTSVIVHNIRRFFTETTPLYTLITFAPWAAILCIRAYKKESVSSTELCAFSFSMLVLLAYTRTPGWYRYLFPANVFILFFLPASLISLGNLWSSQKRIPLLFSRWGVPVLLAALLVFQLYYTAFGSWIASSSTGTRADELEGYFSSLPAQTSIYIFDQPEVVPFLKTQNYYQYFSAGSVWVAGSSTLMQLSSGVPDIVIVAGDSVDSVASYTTHYRLSRTLSGYDILEKI